jgi:type II secretory pathway component GspD/PulD (secretin)
MCLARADLRGQDAVVEAQGVVTEATPAAGPQPAPAATDPSGAKVRVVPGKEGPGGPGEAKQPGAEGKPEEKKKEETPSTPEAVTRPKEPPAPADPAELKARPSDDGVIRFSFRNQPWPAVLQWLADVSSLSLDWQELPGDYLNLTLQRGYTLVEARDLINRHLLARGYTMIQEGETLTVVNLSKLNPAMVPRVSPAELQDRQPHEVVKVTFPLKWMLAENAAQQFKPLLSPNWGKLDPLPDVNMLEAIDAVTNLREIQRLLAQQQSGGDEERLVREFVLEYTRPSDVRELLMELLGIESKSKEAAGPMTPEQMQMMQQRAMMQQQMAQQQQQQGRGAAPGGEKKDELSLIVNSRSNSILATAPPDKMAIIEEAVKMLDVPNARSESLLANMTRLQVYRLSGIDPDPLVKTLEELGDLSPETRLEVDTKNRAIIAYATLADHVTIRTMVEKLDGSARSLEVIPLRRLSADYVAGTLKFLLGGDEEQNQRRMPYYYYYGERGQDQSKDSFRVDADVENNRLLVWANPTELEEVINLLGKLGEIPQRGGDPRRVRTLEVVPSQQSAEFFQRLQEAWKALSPHELHIDPKLEESVPTESKDEPAAQPPPAKATGETAAVPQGGGKSAAVTEPYAAVTEPYTAVLVQLRRGVDEETTPPLPEEKTSRRAPLPENAASDAAPLRSPGEARTTSAPISITRGPDGRLVISSSDPQALDLLEDLMREMAPRRKEFEVFQLKYAPAFWVALNLEDFFEEKEDENRNFGYPYFYYDYPRESEKEDPRRLSNRPPLKFISDDDTNTIVVQGADPQQLQTVKELIELYDQAPPEDAQSRRVTQIFSIRYSKADVIAEAVKDVYRDLLSSNDKALAQNQQQQQNQRPPGETYITNIGFGEEDEQRDRRTQVTFKGKLSIGVDEMTNTLLVSTEGEGLMRNIQEMVQRLDEAAKPRSAVEVLHVGGSGAVGLQKALSEIFRDQLRGQGQQGQQGQPGHQRHPGQPDVNLQNVQPAG